MIAEIQQAISSFWAKIKDRLDIKEVTDNVSPFAFVYLVAFTIYNWELIWTIFFVGTTHQNFAEQIRLIKTELGNLTRCQRIFNPLARALLYISFYYLLSNLFLGIKVFSNRQLRALVYYVFDRGRLAPSIDLDKARLEKADLKNELDEKEEKLETEKTKYRDKAKDLESVEKDYNDLNDQKNKLEKRFEDKVKGLEEEIFRQKDTIKSFAKDQILYAFYGSGLKGFDVTNLLSNTLATAKKIKISNSEFGGDPIPNTIKELSIVLIHDSETRKFIGTEGQMIISKSGEISISDTEVSIDKLSRLAISNKQYEFIANFFGNDVWDKKIIKEGEPTIGYRLIYDPENHAWTNDKDPNYRRLRSLTVNEDKIIFTLTTELGEVDSTEILSFPNKNLLQGFNNKGQEIRYQKDNSTRAARDLKRR